jgi:Bacterial low temperature requirement A protein (LtrA)
MPGFPIRAAHFVERRGLIILIALGESIVAVGIGMAGRGLRADRVVTAVLGLALAAALPPATIGLAGSLQAQLGVLAAVVVGGVLAEPAWEDRMRAVAGG